MQCVPVILLLYHFWKMQQHQQGLGFTPKFPGGPQEDVSSVCREGAVCQHVSAPSPCLWLIQKVLSLFSLFFLLLGEDAHSSWCFGYKQLNCSLGVSVLELDLMVVVSGQVKKSLWSLQSLFQWHFACYRGRRQRGEDRKTLDAFWKAFMSSVKSH